MKSSLSTIPTIPTIPTIHSSAVLDPGCYPPATEPTFYFIGVTTGKSSIMQVFPRWMQELGRGEVLLRGIDFPQHADSKSYRAAVEFIKNDPLSLGGLVTTHKIDLLKACRDLFDELDPYANLMGEISCISKRAGQLRGHAKDPITSGYALEAFLPLNHWIETAAEALVLGAGGSSIAVCSYLCDPARGKNRPSRLVVTNRSKARLEEIKRIHDEAKIDLPREYHICPTPEDNDTQIGGLKPGSLVINATGLGKDAPGSPVSDAVIFPEKGISWEFNYRGDLLYLDQSRAQTASRNLLVEDGWIYFIHGWSSVIAEVLGIDIPSKGKLIESLSTIAAEVRS